MNLKKEHFCKEFADNTHVYDSSKHCFMTVDGKEYFLDSGVHRFRNLNGEVEIGTLSHTSNRIMSISYTSLSQRDLERLYQEIQQKDF